MDRRPTALIADDEPLLREDLARKLAQAWPELELVAQARNGHEALEQFEARRPEVLPVSRSFLHLFRQM